MSIRIPNTLLARVDAAVASGNTCVTNRHQVFRLADRKFGRLAAEEQAAALSVARGKNLKCTTSDSTSVRLTYRMDRTPGEFRAVLSWYMDDYEARPQLPTFQPPEGNYVIIEEA